MKKEIVLAKNILYAENEARKKILESNRRSR